MTVAAEWPPNLDARGWALDGGATMYHAIEYASVEGFRPLQLDLYLPAPSNAPVPAIVYFHGGGWSLGTRRRFGRAFKSWQPSALERLAAAGFAVATVDYRLSGEAVFPAQLHDAKAAVRWVRANAELLNVDPTRIVAWGESAGGHIAALVGLTGDRPDLEGAVGDLRFSSSVCGVVEHYTPTELLAGAEQRHPDSDADPNSADSAESRMIGAALTERPDLARAASPVTYAHAGAPPFHIHHGTDDRMVPFGQATSLVAALQAVDVPVELVAVEGADHFWIGAPDLEAIFAAGVDFARRVTGLACWLPSR